MRFSPRQCDLMIVAGRVVMKMVPVMQRIWLQMPEPKWCISMGACASVGRRVRHLRRGAGHRPLHPGGRVRAGLPAAAGAADPRGPRPAGEDPADRARSTPASSPTATAYEGPTALAKELGAEETIVAPGDFTTATRLRDAAELTSAKPGRVSDRRAAH